MTEHGGSTPLFAVFLLSILSLILIPVSIYKLCGGSSSDNEVVQPWLSKDQKKKSILKKLAGLMTCGNIMLLLGWLFCFALVYYVQESSKSLKPFDPFEVLGVPTTATDKEIKRAFRQLSLKFHPDKNPDPQAQVYFTEYINKAYRALTDETARKNYEKYGDPDGPQTMNLGVALPEWFFSKDKNTAPLLLAALVGCGILLPLAAAACYLLQSNKYAGPNQIMQETIGMFLRSKYCIKESQGVSRIPETLVIAMEFIQMATPPEQSIPLEELRKTVLRLQPDLKEKSLFWKRKASVVKVHMLLIAYLSREEIPDALNNDLKFLLKRAPILLEEMMKIASLPRPPLGFGWLTPAVACVEFSQSMVQAVPLYARKPTSTGGKAMDNLAPMLQLPHVDGDILRKLSRKKCKTLADLNSLPVKERASLLESVGIRDKQLEDVETALLALPALTVSSVRFIIEGQEEEEDIMENDIVTCAVKVIVSRASHTLLGLDKDSVRGKAAQAFAPSYPYPKEENWWFILGDPVNNWLLTMKREGLMEAEQFGAIKAQELKAGHRFTNGTREAEGKVNGALAANSGKEDEELSPGGIEAYCEGDEDKGQLVELKFRAPKSGKRDLMLYCMCDSWVGSDRLIPLKLKIVEMTRAEQEGRMYRGKSTPVDADDAGSEDMEAEGSDEEEDEDDYDSEESGTEESGEEEDDEEEADDEQSEDDEMPPLGE